MAKKEARKVETPAQKYLSHRQRLQAGAHMLKLQEYLIINYNYEFKLSELEEMWREFCVSKSTLILPANDESMQNFWAWLSA